MGTILNIRLFLGLIIFACSSCEIFEFRGFFLSYEDADERFSQSMAWNNINPYIEIITDEDNYLIYVMADSHTGSTYNLNYFFMNAIENNAVSAVMVGDLTTGHAVDYRVFYNALPDRNELITFPVAGNHDIYFDGWKQFRSLFGTSTYLFLVTTPGGSDLYICLDTAGGTLGKLQYEWLAQILKDERHKHRRCIVFTHNNILQFRKIATTTPNLEELYALNELFIVHQVDMVITGHDHQKDYREFGGTKYISLDALVDGYKFAGFIKLMVNDGNLSFAHFNLP